MRTRRKIFIAGLLISLIPLKYIQSKVSSSSSSKIVASKVIQKALTTVDNEDNVIFMSFETPKIGEKFLAYTPLPGGGILDYLKLGLISARGPPKNT